MKRARPRPNNGDNNYLNHTSSILHYNKQTILNKMKKNKFSEYIKAFDFKNLFNAEKNNFNLDAKFSELTSTYVDLKSLLPNVLGASIPSSFDRLGKFTLVGESKVTTSEIFANVKIETEIGFVDSDLKMTRVNNIDNASYDGNIIFKDFDLGVFIDDPNFGLVSLNLDVNGNGFIAEVLDTQVKGDVYQIVFNDYNYQNIKVAGNIRNKIFDGNLIINDKNLKCDFNGLVDFSEIIKKP